MSVQDRVDEIYNDLLRIRNDFEYEKPVKSLSSNYCNIKKILTVIVEANFDFLFTPAFDYFIISYSLYHTKYIDNFRYNLSLILYNLFDFNKMIDLLSHYIDNWVSYDYRFLKHAYDKDGKIIRYDDLLTAKEKELYDKYTFSRTRISSNKELFDSDYGLIKKIFQIIGAITLINNQIGDYDKLINPYEINFREKIDELVLQGICKYSDYRDYDRYRYEPEQLVSYIKSKIGSDNLILIR